MWTVGWLHYPDSFSAMLPDVRRRGTSPPADLSLVRQQFRDAVAPVAYVGGWALLASVGTAFVVFTGDTFAFRANGRGEALVPGAVLFVFVAALGVDRHRIALDRWRSSPPGSWPPRCCGPVRAAAAHAARAARAAR